jgi:hypothetical protein
MEILVMHIEIFRQIWRTKPYAFLVHTAVRHAIISPIRTLNVFG